MGLVFTFMSVSVDGYICGPNGGPGAGLADNEPIFDWYFNGPQPSRVYPGFAMTPANAAVLDAIGMRIGAVIAGRNTYEHSGRWAGAGPHPNAPLFVLSHAPIPDAAPGVTVVTDGITSAIAKAKLAAGDDKDVALMGGATITAALRAGLVDEITIHQRPILLGGGTPLFQALPQAIPLHRTGITVTHDVTHLAYSVHHPPKPQRPEATEPLPQTAR